MDSLPIALVLVSTLMHVAWNLFFHSRPGTTDLFLRTSLLFGLFGCVPVIVAESLHPTLTPAVWGLLAISGIFQSVYAIGLTMAYRQGDFTLVYPLARSLPILGLAVFDIGRGRAPSPLGWAGIALVVVGCVFAPVPSLRRWNIACYFHRTMIWVLVIAAGTTGYTLVDKIAMERIPSGPLAALQYGVVEFAAAGPCIWLFFRFYNRRTGHIKPAGWRGVVLVAAMILGTYVLVLWSYQLVDRVSYVVALRQFSIVVGAGLGFIVLREPSAGHRFAAALLITAGVVCVCLG